jgi:RNA polymerase sigma factor (sigma-70 family)
MSNKDSANPINSPQILPFPVENQPSQLSINIDDADNKLFYNEYFPLIKRHCFSVLRNEEDAKDIANDVFEKVHKLKTKGKIIDYPKTYLSRMAENMSKNKKKKERRELMELYDMAINESYKGFKNIGEKEQKEWETGIIDNGYEQVEAEIIIKSILDEQDKITCKIYFYYYHDSMSYKEIGKILGLSISAVQKRIKNFEKKVKEAIEGGIK